MEYLDFDIVIEQYDDALRTRVQQSPFGTPEHTFTFPFSATEIDALVALVGPDRGEDDGEGGQRGGRRARPAVARGDDPREFGRRLYDEAFGGEVGTTLLRCLDQADRDGAGVRLRLRIEDRTDLHDVPWELLYSDRLRRYLAMSQTTPVVRFLDLQEQVRPLSVLAPLRVLVAVSEPRGVRLLKTGQEVARLRVATAGLERRGLLSLRVLEHATFSAVRQELVDARDREQPFHVLHYIGHGTFDDATGAGALVLEGDDGTRRDVTGHDLAMVLHDIPSLRLAVLNTCEGARTSRRDPFGGVAQSLVRQGIPAVLAMQFRITDTAARLFAEEFYTGLSRGKSVDTATAESRQAVFAAHQSMEWATPVLYLRCPDGRIFDVDTGTGAVLRELGEPAAAAGPQPAQAAPGVVLPPVADASAAPFTVGPPVGHPAAFFGRYEQVRALLARLRNPPLQNVAVVGVRRSGKTSLLRHLAQLAAADPAALRPSQRERYNLAPFGAHRFIGVDFQHPGFATRDGFMRRVLDRLGGAPDGPLPLDRFHDEMLARLDRPTVVLLDEVGVALQRRSAEFDDGFWDALRALASSDEGIRLAFVLGTHDLPSVLATANAYASPFFNIIGYTARLGPLTDSDARELVGSSPVPFPQSETDWILERSHGWPVVLQALSAELLATLEGGGPLDPAWREAALEQAAPFTGALPGFEPDQDQQDEQDAP